MSDERYTGMDSESAQKLILKIIEVRPGIRPRELETRLTKGEHGSNPTMSRSTYNRAKGKLLSEGKVETETRGQAVRYYLKGRKPSLPYREEPSDLDRFIVVECERLLSEVLGTTVALYDPRSEGIPVSIESGAIKPEELQRLNNRFSALYRLVELWESARGEQVPRPWGTDVAELYLGFGPSFVEYMESQFEGIVQVNERYPDVQEWFNFYICVVDTLSTYIRTKDRRVRQPKPPQKADKTSRTDTMGVK